jgi:hypothetical protein
VSPPYVTPHLTDEQLRERRDEYVRRYGREPRFTAFPVPGFWAVRLANGAPEVGAAIIRRTRRSPDPASQANIQGECNMLDAFLDGRLVSLDEVWLRRGRTIDEREYQFLLDDRKWARSFRPRAPEANPHDRADLRAMPPVLPRRT